MGIIALKGESISYIFFLMFNNRVDGGVSKNDFVLQLLADLTKLPVERPKNIEKSDLGAAFLAGLNSGSKFDLYLL